MFRNVVIAIAVVLAGCTAARAYLAYMALGA